VPDQEREARTEEPTPRRREEAREKGQIARSTDLTSAIVLLAGIVFVRFYGPVMIDDLKGLTMETLHWMGDPQGDGQEYYHQAWVVAWGMLKILAPISLFLMAMGLAANWVQFGFVWATEPLTPNLDKINPINGFRRIVSLRGAEMLVSSLLKVAAAMLVLWLRFRSDLGQMLLLPEMGLQPALAVIYSLLFRAGMELVIILLALAILDYLFQRMIMQHMMRRVPEAEVVITNPTHLAIALKYDEEQMAAPEVVAKGERLVAQRIKQIAYQHGVPVVENKPLAQAMYRAVEVGTQIPKQFYEAVAEVLALVYGLDERRRRRSA
jgi:flagellar biosynthetic protein FlhB